MTEDATPPLTTERSKQRTEQTFNFQLVKLKLNEPVMLCLTK